MTDHVRHEAGPFALVPLWLLEALMERGSKALPLFVALHRWSSGDDRTCYPSRKTLADYLGVGTSTIDRWSTDLQDVGALTVTRRYTEDGDPTSNLYTLRIVKPPLPTDGETPLPIGEATPLPTGGSLTKPTSNPDPIENPHTVEQLTSTEQGWECFWEQYPRKQGKAEARKRWDKMGAADRTAALNALQDWCRFYTTVDPKFVPYASTWLNQQRWQDDLPGSEPAATITSTESVWCDDCEGTGWIEVVDPSLRSGVGMAKCGHRES